jgi:hypothetical protein
MWLSILSGEKTRSFEKSAVCLSSPFTFVVRLNELMLNSSGLIRVGPMGANLSKALAKKNWPPELPGSWN